jgi:outer membrane protein assembly factor BamA
VPGWVIVPYVFDYPGLGQGYGILGGATNIGGTYTDVAGTVFTGDVNGQAAGIEAIHLIPRKLILDVGGVHVSRITLQSYSQRGMATQKNDYTLLEFGNSAFGGSRLTATFFDRRFELYAGFYGGYAQFKSIRDQDGNVIIEAQDPARSRTTTTVFGTRFDLTDDYLDPRRGLRFEMSRWSTPPQDLGPDFFFMDYSATAYVPLGRRSTWVFNYFRSDARVLRKGETDPGVISQNLGLNCDSLTGPQKAECQQVIDSIIAENTYGTASSLGGLNRLRSYPEGRYKGAHTEFFGTEVRWNLTEEYKPFNIVIMKDVRTAFQVAVFYEIGTVADQRSALWDIARSSYGVGARMVTASGLVYRVDLASGNEGFQTSIFFQYPWEL